MANQKDYKDKYKALKAELAFLTKKIDVVSKNKSEKGLRASLWERLTPEDLVNGGNHHEKGDAASGQNMDENKMGKNSIFLLCCYDNQSMDLIRPRGSLDRCDGRFIIRTSLTGFPAQSVRSSNADALDSLGGDGGSVDVVLVVAVKLEGPFLFGHVYLYISINRDRQIDRCLKLDENFAWLIGMLYLNQMECCGTTGLRLVYSPINLVQAVDPWSIFQCALVVDLLMHVGWDNNSVKRISPRTRNKHKIILLEWFCGTGLVEVGGREEGDCVPSPEMTCSRSQQLRTGPELMCAGACLNVIACSSDQNSLSLGSIGDISLFQQPILYPSFLGLKDVPAPKLRVPALTSRVFSHSYGLVISLFEPFGGSLSTLVVLEVNIFLVGTHLRPTVLKILPVDFHLRQDLGGFGLLPLAVLCDLRRTAYNRFGHPLPAADQDTLAQIPGQALEKVNGVDLFYLCSMDRGTTNVSHILAQYLFRHAEGRKSGARLSGGHFIGGLTMHFSLVHDKGLRGLQGPERQRGTVAGAHEADEAGLAAKEGSQEIPAPAHAPPPPPPAPHP
ncbi:hypothetical protein Tco_1501449 [Tanacetum coccineum]